jgi:hypothetical protein
VSDLDPLKDLGGVKRLVPRSSRADPKIRGAPTLRKWRSDPGTHGVRVHAVTYGWQKSVGRISRLAHRPVARPGGGISRALARRKLEARSDAGHEQRDGEAVRGCT